MGRLRPPFGRFKLNLNSIAPGVLAWGSLFLLVVPALLFIFGAQSYSPGIWLAIAFSIALGLVIYSLLLVLIVAEFVQDRWRDAFYARHRNIKLKISASDYECQNCGNRQIKMDDRMCPVCGQRFQEVLSGADQSTPTR